VRSELYILIPSEMAMAFNPLVGHNVIVLRNTVTAVTVYY